MRSILELAAAGARTEHPHLVLAEFLEVTTDLGPRRTAEIRRIAHPEPILLNNRIENALPQPLHTVERRVSLVFQ